MKSFLRIIYSLWFSLSSIGLHVALGEEAYLVPMVVVESKSPVPLSQSSPWVSRISAEELDKKQIYNLADALRTVPGMAVVRSGQLGSQTSLFSRGGESNHVAFFYEGRKLNGGFSGTYNLGELSTLSSSSIEVLRGSSSSLYGGHAMGGTVYMRSELPKVDGYGSQVSLSGGSFDTLSSNYKTNFKSGPWAGNFGFSSVESDNDRPNSKLENLSSSFLVERQLSDVFSMNLLLLGYTNDFGVIGSTSWLTPEAYQQTDHYLISPKIKFVTDEYEAHFTYSFSRDDLFYFGSSADQTKSLTDQQVIDSLVEFEVADDFQIQFGTSYSSLKFHQNGLSSWEPSWSEGNGWEQLSASFGFQYLFAQDSEVSGDFRYDDYSDFDNPLTYDLKFKTKLSEYLSAFAKHGISYAPPTALDLYGIGPTSWYPGNLLLVAEDSENYEVGFSFLDDAKKTTIKISYFYSDYENKIDMTPKNIKESSSSGLEFYLRNNFTDSLYFTSSVTYMRSKNKENGEDFLPRRPELFGSIATIYEKQKVTLGIQANFKQNTKENILVDADDYAIFRIFNNFEISDRLSITSRVENLFDTHYEEVNGYPALGRAIHAGLSYSF